MQPVNHTLNRLIIVFCILVVFGQACSFSFIAYDDPINITKNPEVTTVSWQHFRSIWEKPQSNLYIPVTYTVWASVAIASHFLFSKKLNPFFFHSTNLVFHILNSLLVYAVLLQILALQKRRPIARVEALAPLIGALFFALYPVQVEPVVWATGLKDLLYTFFSLIAVWLFLRIHKPNGDLHGWYSETGIYLLTSLFFLLAVLSKPTAVILPVFLFVIVWGATARLPSGKEMLLIFAWLVLALFCVMWTRSAQPGGESIPIFDRFLVAADAVVFYLGKLIYPFSPALDYGKTLSHVLHQPWLFLYPVIIFALLILLFFLPDRKTWYSCLALVVIGVLPVLGFVSFDYQRISIVADRYLYLSMVGFSVAIMFIVFRYRQDKYIIVVLLLFLASAAIISTRYASRWQNTESLMRYTLMQTPRSFVANHNLGIALMRHGKIKKSIPYFKKALQIDNKSVLARYNLAVAYACEDNRKAAWRQQQNLKALNADVADKLKTIIPNIIESIESGHLSDKLKIQRID